MKYFNKIRFYIDIFYTLIITTIGFLFFTYMFFPKEENITILGVVINSGYYEKIDLLFWNIFNHSLIILLFSIWFITCKYWWRYLILLIIFFEIEKLSFVIFDSKDVIGNYYYIIAFAFIYISIIIFISNKQKYYYSKKIKTKIDLEISSLINNNVLKRKGGNIKLRLFELRKSKREYKKKEYLIKLIELRNDYT